MSLIKKNGVHCAGQITTAGAAYAQVSPPANQPSFFTGARTGAGAVTITLDEQIDPTERVEIFSNGTTLGGGSTVAGTDATVLLESRTASTGVALDGIVNFAVIRVAF